MIALVLAFILLGANWSSSWGADPPCDKYPPGKQVRCAEIWKELNKEDGPLIAQFGLEVEFFNTTPRSLVTSSLQ